MFKSKYFGKNYFNSFLYPEGGDIRVLITIDGSSVLPYLVTDSLSINISLNNRATANFLIESSSNYMPQVGEEVIIEYTVSDGEPAQRVFGGTIDRISSRARFATDENPLISIDCVDFQAVLDNRLVYNLYNAQPAKDVISDIVTQFLDDEGINTDNVLTQNTLLDKCVFAYVKASKAFDDISKVTGLYYYIDFYKNLYFFLRSENQTDTVIGTTVEAGDTETTCEYIARTESANGGTRLGNVTVKTTREKIINKQFVTAGFDETILRSETFVGDGERRTFNLKYPLSTLKKDPDGVTISADAVKVDTSNQTVADRDDESTEAQAKQWFYSKGSNEISQNDDNTPLTSSQVLTVNYKGLFPVVAISSNGNDSIAERATIENSSGKYEAVEDDNSIESYDYAFAYANGIVSRFKKPQTQVEFDTDTQVLTVGDIVTVNLPVYQILNDNSFMVEAVDIKSLPNGMFRFYYSLINTDYQGGWQEFFKRVEYFGRQIKLKENQTLVSSEVSTDAITFSQTLDWAYGNSLVAQDVNYDQSYMHATEPAMIGQAFHSKIEVA